MRQLAEVSPEFDVCIYYVTKYFHHGRGILTK